MSQLLKISVVIALLNASLVSAKSTFELENKTKKTINATNIQEQDEHRKIKKKEDKNVKPEKTEKLFSIERTSSYSKSFTKPSKGQADIYVDGKGPIKLRATSEIGEIRAGKMGWSVSVPDDLKEKFIVQAKRYKKWNWRHDNVRITIRTPSAFESISRKTTEKRKALQ